VTRNRGDVELPPPQAEANRQAVRLEWLTVAYLASAVALLYLTAGSSQAMKAAWLEDLLSVLPPLVFLIASRFRRRPPTERYPYGYHRVVSIAYLCASLALFTLGSFVLFDSAAKLFAAEHPPIGTVALFGETIWLGWLMLPALAWSAVPAVFLGRAKMPLAQALHDKVLYADAKMNKADWLTAGAAMVGIVGIGLGLWWADAAAAIVISLDIIHDGFTNLRQALADLRTRGPRATTGRSRIRSSPRSSARPGAWTGSRRRACACARRGTSSPGRSSWCPSRGRRTSWGRSSGRASGSWRSTGACTTSWSRPCPSSSRRRPSRRRSGPSAEPRAAVEEALRAER
jgi:cation diffusion facilitator family transporter